MDRRLPVSGENREAIELGGAQHVHHCVYSFHSLEANHRTCHDLQVMHAQINQSTNPSINKSINQSINQPSID